MPVPNSVFELLLPSTGLSVDSLFLVTAEVLTKLELLLTRLFLLFPELVALVLVFDFFLPFTL